MMTTLHLWPLVCSLINSPCFAALLPKFNSSVGKTRQEVDLQLEFLENLRVLVCMEVLLSVFMIIIDNILSTWPLEKGKLKTSSLRARTQVFFRGGKGAPAPTPCSSLIPSFICSDGCIVWLAHTTCYMSLLPLNFRKSQFAPLINFSRKIPEDIPPLSCICSYTRFSVRFTSNPEPEISPCIVYCILYFILDLHLLPPRVS